MPAPLQVFAQGAVDVYLAPTGTAEPLLNVAPPGSFVKIGTAGSLDYTEDGVTVTKSTENNTIYGSGGYGVRKVYRTREGLVIGLTVMDATLETYRDAFNQAVVTAAMIGAGPSADKSIPLVENVATPTYRTLLIRMANSPYLDGGSVQWWVPLVYQTGTITTQYRKAEPVGITLEFTAIQDTTGGFGKMRAQTVL